MIPAMANALGIDVGTTNVKVALVRRRRHDRRRRAAAARRCTGPASIAEQDADAMWAALVDAVREVTAAHPDEAAATCTRSASAASTRRSSRSTTDARPLAPMLMWQDQRGTDHCVRDHGARRRTRS